MSELLQQCMGGMCARREKCAHYWAPAMPMVPPAERLCSRDDEVPTEWHPMVLLGVQRLEIPMTEDDYSEFVAARFTKRCTGEDGLMHCAVGISGEGGELLDAVKKLWVYGKPLDRQNAIEELGDIEFYAAAMRSLLDVSREEVIAQNVAKLSKRYPTTYTDELAIARLDKAAA